MAFHLEGTYVENCTGDVICRVSLLGIEYSGDGTAGFSAAFSWAA